MTYVEANSGHVVARVVYDGPPYAGKTTNLRTIGDQLGERRAGELYSPHSKGRRTEYFDWLEFTGSYVAGRRVLCQLVSVAGQAELTHRREIALETADVIVFVVDSRSEFMTEARAALAMTMRVVEAADRTVPIVVQANKQDLPGALAPPQVRRQLGLSERMTVIGAASDSGHGVMYTFVMAARFAIDQAREFIENGVTGAIDGEARGKDELLSTMLSRDRGNEPQGSVRSPALDQSGEPEGERWPDVPDAARIEAGHVWPPLRGREFFAWGTPSSGRKYFAFVEDAEAYVVSTDNGFRLQSFVADSFDSEHDAQVELIETAKNCARCADWVEPTLAVAIYPDEAQWRLWTIVRDRPSLRQTLVAARDDRTRTELLETIRGHEQTLSTLKQPVRWLVETARLDCLTLEQNRLFLHAVRYPGDRQDRTTLLGSAENLLNLRRWGTVSPQESEGS